MFIWKHPSPPSGWVVVKNVTAEDGAKTETIVGEFEGERAGRRAVDHVTVLEAKYWVPPEAEREPGEISGEIRT